MNNRFFHKLTHSFWPMFWFAVVLILIGIGIRDPWPADEPRFALIAKEMVDTGQWFFPARAQELYPDKPPVFMWSIALFYGLTGSMKIAFLLPSALSGLLTLFLVYDIGKRLWDKQVGLVAAWLLLFSFQFILQAKTAQIDAMVCAWITIGCYGLLRYCLVDGHYKWYAIAWFFMGIGVITKGVGFLSLLMLLPYIWYRFNTKNQTHVVNAPLGSWFTGPLIMLGAIGLWFIPMLIIVAQSDNVAFEAYRDNILFKQTVTRYADSWHHIKPFWYYITSVIPTFWLPGILAVPWLIKPWFKSFKSFNPKIMLPLGFVLLVIIFFSLSPGKRGVYLLPALPMLVLSIAPFYKKLAEVTILKYLLLGICVCLCAIFLALGILGLSGVPAVIKLADKIDITPWYFFIAIGLFTSVGLFLAVRKQLWLAWPLFMSASWLIYSTYGYILRNEVSTPVAIYKKVEQILSNRQQINDTVPAVIALLDFSEQFVLFSPFPIVHFGYHTPNDIQLDAAYKWQTQPNQYLLVKEKLLVDSCFNADKAIDLGFAHRRHWLLVPLSAKHKKCELLDNSTKKYSYMPSNINIVNKPKKDTTK